MQRLVRRWGAEVVAATRGTTVSPALALAVMAVESAGEATAISPKGAQGVMQLIPATAARFGVADALDGAENIRGGVAYLDWLMRRFDGDPVLVLAAYNAGEGAVQAHAGVPPYAETRAYVPKVLAAWQAARGLCAVPPTVLTDPCALRLQGP
jgi:soluble lytic murein transglycosylase-like protein